MSAGTKTILSFKTKDVDFRNTLLPSIDGLADGTYALSIVISGGVPSLALVEPASDQVITISGLTSFTIKNGSVTAMV